MQPLPDTMHRDLPLVSVIISCFNHEDYIQACIESVVRQTYPNIELIVFDDGSSDNSPAILKALSEEHGFFFEAQVNIGLSGTLNKGLAMARGKYINPLGSDDILMLDKIEKQVNFLEQHEDFSMLGGNRLLIDEKGSIIPKQKFTAYREVDFEGVLLNLKSGPSTPTTMIRADVLREIGGYNPKNNLEDLYLWLKITHTGHKIAILNDVLAYYRIHGTNTTKKYRFMTESILDIYSDYQDYPAYTRARNKVLISRFLKIAEKDRRYAWDLLKQINPSFYNLKVLRGFIRLLLPRQDRKNR
jgi:alpha-1,3-rhamnosyltransferase